MIELRSVPKPPPREPKPHTRLKRRNRVRHTRRWLRAYGSEAHVEFVKQLKCLVANPECSEDWRETAHIPGAEGAGMGIKGYANQVVPLCKHHHDELDDELGGPDFEAKYGVDLKAAAAITEASWQTQCEDSQ